jgi:acetolactate synthase I/II/III large subunit
MKSSDYIINVLADMGIDYIFGVTGGAAVHIFDSLSKQDKIKYICMNHEQGAAMAADGYSRVGERMGVALATSGPGVANLMNGIMCSYYDSISTLFLTGQVASYRLRKNNNVDVRQIGFQELDTIEMYSNITKYSTQLKSLNDIKYEIEKSIFISNNKRRGPVVIDIPDDFQRTDININNQYEYIDNTTSLDIDQKKIIETISKLKKSKRPLLIIGMGVSLSNNKMLIHKLVETLSIPFLLTWGALDLFESNHPLNMGTFGIQGNRHGNFAVQRADLILSIGSRLDTHCTGSPETFAPNAKKIIQDIDKEELNKFSKYKLKDALLVHMEIEDFVQGLINNKNIGEKKKWTKYLRELKESSLDGDRGFIYSFIDALSKDAKEEDIMFLDTGSSLVVTTQAWNVKENQQIHSDWNNTSMGYALPASIGASFATNKGEIICITGDGGLLMNMQELAVIKKYNLPIKIFVFNNKGYGMIRQTIDDWLDSNYIACDSKDISLVDWKRISFAFNLDYKKIENKDDFKKIKQVLDSNMPVICEIIIDETQRIIPKMKYGQRLDEMEPRIKIREMDDGD